MRAAQGATRELGGPGDVGEPVEHEDAGEVGPGGVAGYGSSGLSSLR
jgi:hypothetical protein